MTVGALIQLEYGNTDRMAFLTLNPQITHFKSVYRKYTNFSTEFITVLSTLDILVFCVAFTPCNMVILFVAVLAISLAKVSYDVITPLVKEIISIFSPTNGASENVIKLPLNEYDAFNCVAPSKVMNV